MFTAPLPSTPRSNQELETHSISKMADSSIKDCSSSSPSSSSTSLMTCPICLRQLKNPHMLPCLHIFCLNCLRDECVGKVADKFFCPSCVAMSDDGGANDDSGGVAGTNTRKSYNSRIWHSFDKILEQENGDDDERQRRLAELPASSNDDAEIYRINNEDEEEDLADNSEKTAILEAPLLFPCSMHPDRLSDTFCLKCDQLACHKCISSFHRRCQKFSALQDAVDSKKSEFDSVHDKMADNLVACEEMVDTQRKRLQEIEETRTEILVHIKTFRMDLVNAILAKEKLLTQEANHLLDELKDDAIVKNEKAGKMAISLQKQMELLDLSFSIKGEAELLPLLPGLAARIDNDSMLISKQYTHTVDTLSKVSFFPDEKIKTAMDASPLGEIHLEGGVAQNSSLQTGNGNTMTITAIETRPNLDLSLVTSFHGGSREDQTDPLLTDLIVIANGDIILTDRDNRCVKKFTPTGKLLTRVLLDAIPSRIATVSHARAVVSVMNRKRLYFLSLFGTVRILHTVKVKKLYSFLTSMGNGLLVAGTNLCDNIDVLNERGETIRSIFTQKPEKASISRPLYLTPAVPRSTTMIMSKTTTKEDNTCTNTINGAAAITDDGGNNKINGRRKSNSGYGASASSMPTITRKNMNNSNAGIKIDPSDDNSIKGNSDNSNKKSTKINSTTTTTGAGNSKGLLTIPNSSKKSNSKKNQSHSSSSSSHSGVSFKKSPSPTLSDNHLLLQPPSATTTATSSSPSPSTSSSISSSSSSSSSSSPSLLQDVLVSDSGKRIMFHLQDKGATTFTFRSSDQVTLECPLGVTVHKKTGLTLLADRDSDCVLLLDQNGNFLKKVLTQQDGLTKPCAIYAGVKGGVALSQVDGMVKIYKAL